MAKTKETEQGKHRQRARETRTAVRRAKQRLKKPLKKPVEQVKPAALFVEEVENRFKGFKQLLKDAFD